MRFLADMGVSLTTVEALRAAGHDAMNDSIGIEPQTAPDADGAGQVL